MTIERDESDAQVQTYMIRYRIFQLQRGGNLRSLPVLVPADDLALAVCGESLGWMLGLMSLGS